VCTYTLSNLDPQLIQEGRGPFSFVAEVMAPPRGCVQAPDVLS
jgi:hypothetical protein